MSTVGGLSHQNGAVAEVALLPQSPQLLHQLTAVVGQLHHSVSVKCQDKPTTLFLCPKKPTSAEIDPTYEQFTCETIEQSFKFDCCCFEGSVIIAEIDQLNG